MIEIVSTRHHHLKMAEKGLELAETEIAPDMLTLLTCHVDAEQQQPSQEFTF